MRMDVTCTLGMPSCMRVSCCVSCYESHLINWAFVVPVHICEKSNVSNTTQQRQDNTQTHIMWHTCRVSGWRKVKEDCWHVSVIFLWCIVSLMGYPCVMWHKMRGCDGLFLLLKICFVRNWRVDEMKKMEMKIPLILCFHTLQTNIYHLNKHAALSSCHISLHITHALSVVIMRNINNIYINLQPPIKVSNHHANVHGERVQRRNRHISIERNGKVAFCYMWNQFKTDYFRDIHGEST